ncbi:MAG: hypothetical protein HOK30_20305 [Rhodospirillaceae bacterium]|jgi:hypothetical protein|nr:hypothetical protein [Rhodospirillaceae bacterium]MBT5190922.1 hypothetical protein [Rhodospirillaceae bacterium]MBT6430023.1 hypothetical protein [Rhodospirillaceae bacterium]MBT7757185.1 hypothetical protein [Rhodospirillaceae bacterium]
MKMKLCAIPKLLFGSVIAALLALSTAHAGSGPYVVGGNQHLMIGITLDGAAVRAALPKGLEPTEGITGGLNIYTSKGSAATPAYSRFYVWADVNGHDSITGGKARYILWAATSNGPDKLKKAGNMEVQGATNLTKSGADISGATTVGGTQIVKAAIKLADGPKCGPAAGSLNYPSLPDPAGKLMVTQYTFTATICGAAPVSADIMVDAGHALAKFKPTKLIWAAYAKDLSFAGSPLMPIKMVGK